MPHRRRVEKGSFGGQLDDLIKVFPKEPPGKGSNDPAGAGRHGEQPRVNDRLFESAWRKPRDE